MSQAELIEKIEMLEQKVAVLENQFSGSRKMTVKEACAYTGFKAKSIYRLVYAQEISGNKPGGKVLMINKDSLDKYLSKNPLLSKEQINKIVNA